MTLSIVRFRALSSDNVSSTTVTHWGVRFDRRIAVLPSTASTTEGFLLDGGLEQAAAVTAREATCSVDAVQLLSPVTESQQFICQGVNYESHVRESGLDPSQFPFNTLFTKASSSIIGPHDRVVRPRNVKLLDYEIELGLVLKRAITSPVSVTPETLHEYLAGITIVNDVSARDVQLPQGQFYKGKSYRTFGPVGPCMLVLDPHEWLRWPELRMRLWVNGALRQDDVCGSMLFKPHQTLTELSEIQALRAGDLIATGTPAGCAAKAPGKASLWVARHFLSDSTKWKMFVRNGARNPVYLQPNDVMELHIGTDDGRIDLGRQKNMIVAA